MNIPNFEKLLEDKNYENILEYFPPNIASILMSSVITYSENFPLGEKTAELHSNFNAQELQLIYDNYSNRKWGNDNLDIFKNILLDLKTIDEALQPINAVLGMPYTLSLTGGAVRDFITGKPTKISDLDIVVYIAGTQDISFDLTLEEEKKKTTTKDKFELIYATIEPKLYKLGLNNFVLKDNGSSAEQLIYYLVSSLLKRNVNIKNFYPPRDIEKASANNSDMTTFDVATYNALYLQAVLKIEDKKLNYPVDILLSNVDVEFYNSAFDFNLCKVYFSYHELDSNLKQLINKNMELGSIPKYFNAINYNIDFMEDLIHKKTTFSCNGFNLYQVEASLNKHYPKIQDKYNDYKFYLAESVFKYTRNDDEYINKNLSLSSLTVDDLTPSLSEDVRKFIVTTVRYNELDKKIPNKDSGVENPGRPRKI